VEILSWALRLSTPDEPMPDLPPMPREISATPTARVGIADPSTGRTMQVGLHDRTDLPPGSVIAGPALIVEDETTTLVTATYTARINALGHIVMTRSPL
jgi:N-methylhydantoinase A